MDRTTVVSLCNDCVCSQKIVLTLIRPYLETSLQSECSAGFPFPLSLHLDCPYKEFPCIEKSLCTVAAMSEQDLDTEDASLVTGMLAPARLDQLTAFLGGAPPQPRQVDEPSLTTSSLHGLSMDDKVATLSALQPSVAAALLGTEAPSICIESRGSSC